MVTRRVCTFCGSEIEPGTGKMFVKRDGTIFYFCSSKCEKNQIKLKRVPRRTEWTERYARDRS
jgi:large subunit ribosomal protein L24e